MLTKIKNPDDKYRYATLGIVIFLVVAITGAVVISKMDKKPFYDNIAIFLSDGDLAINYIDCNMVNIKDNKKHEYHISVTNNSANRIYYSLSIENIISSKKMNLQLIDENGNNIFETDDVKENNTLLTLAPVEATKTSRYTLIFTANKASDFSGEIKIVNDSMTKQTFGDLILLNNHINTAQTKIGKEISTINEGLLSTKDSNGISYYFRGNVDNNYVKMGDLTFRVVRINGDGSVRLVLNDALPEKYAYNTKKITGEQKQEDLANLNNTSLKEEMNKWIQDNLLEFSHIIVEGDFCTDLEFLNQMNELSYSDTYARIYSFYEPSLVCSNNYKSNVGLLSIDEVVFSGAFKYDKNDKYYLYNPNLEGSYLTLSTLYKDEENNITMLNINEDGSIGSGILLTDKAYIRPVINVSLSTKVKGEGTISNPYIIVA